MRPVSIHLTRFFCLFVGTLLTATVASAQQSQQTSSERRTIVAERLKPGEAITLDGQLEEDVWRRAQVASDFRQIDPDNGMPATEPTEVRIAFDSNTIYLGVVAHDSEGSRGLTRYQKRRDEYLQSDDKVVWTIDTFLDGRSGYFFETNPSGAMSDALMGTTGQNRQWDGIWDERVSRNANGWAFEVAIPFRTLNFNPNSDTWGFNISRSISRKNENTIWMGWARNQGIQRMTNAGHITGLNSVTQGHGLDIKPYVLGTAQDAPLLNQKMKETGRPALISSSTPRPRCART